MERESAEVIVNVKEIAADVIEATEDRPAALKVVFTTKGTNNEVSYSVPLNADAVGRVKPFTDGQPTEFGEQSLREFITANAKSDDMLVNTWGTWIQSFLPPVGNHFGQMASARFNQRGQKVWFTLETRDGYQVDFPSAPIKGLTMQQGDTPERDYIGPKKALNPGSGPWYYFVALGLDWARFLKELEECEALWPGHYDGDGNPLPSYFASMDDIFPDVLDAARRHGLKTVKFEVHDHDQYGRGVKRGDFFFELVEVVVEGGGAAADPRAAEFAHEAETFNDLWDKLTQAVLCKPDSRFMVNGKLTEDGKAIALGILKPVVNAYPAIVKEKKSDGSPNIILHPLTWERGAWTLDGLVAVNFFAQRLLLFLEMADEEEKLDTVNLTDPSNLMSWAAENVAELAADMDADEGELAL